MKMNKSSIQFLVATILVILMVLAPAMPIGAQTTNIVTGYPSQVTYTAQNASTGTVNLCASCPPGTYMVSGYATVNTAFTGVSPNLISTLAWTDASGARTLSLLGTVDTSTTATFKGAITLVTLKAAGAVTISAALSGTATGNLDETYILDRIR